MTSTTTDLEASTYIRPIQFISFGGLSQVPTPLLYVSTCGLLTIEIIDEVISSDPPTARYTLLTPEYIRGRGAAPSLMLLKLLTSRPQRFASKDWLTEQFCYERELYSSARIENIVSLLRGLLCPPAYSDLRRSLVAFVHSGSGDGYQLAAYPLIWVDHEALTSCVEQASRMERFGDDPLPFWQRAYALARRGPYLPDEMYADWATFRREEIAGMLRQSVQALARLYVEQQGKAGEEEALLLLRSYWHDHPHDEDVLRSLMEMLGERGRYHEATGYYERLCQILTAEERQPDAHTQDVAAYLRTKQIQHTAASKSQKNKDIPFAQILADDILPADDGYFAKKSPILPLVERSHMPLLDAGQSPLYMLTEQQLIAFASLCRLGESMMFDPTRRKTLEALLAAVSVAMVRPQGLPQTDLWKHLLTPVTDPARANAATIQGLQSLIEACWQLSRGSELALAEELLPTCMAKIVPLAQQPSAYQRDAIKLAAQGFDLSGILAGHRNDMQAKESYSKQAVRYSHLSGDLSLLIPALRSLGCTYYYTGQHAQALHVYLDALPHVENISPLQQACVYMSLAVAYAHMNQEQESLKHLGLALDTFPEHPETDPSFAYAEFDRPRMILWEGTTRSRLGQAQQALDIFQQIEQPTLPVPGRTRIEIMNQRARTAIFVGDLEQSSTFVEAGLKGAKALGSQRRYNEAYGNFRQMHLLWPQERRVAALGELVH